MMTNCSLVVYHLPYISKMACDRNISPTALSTNYGVASLVQLRAFVGFQGSSNSNFISIVQFHPDFTFKLRMHLYKIIKDNIFFFHSVIHSFIHLITLLHSKQFRTVYSRKHLQIHPFMASPGTRVYMVILGLC